MFIPVKYLRSLNRYFIIIIADLFKDVLEDDGYTVVAFTDSIAALNHIQGNP